MRLYRVGLQDVEAVLTDPSSQSLLLGMTPTS